MATVGSVDTPELFCSKNELVNQIISSGLLQRSLEKIKNDASSEPFRKYPAGKFTIVAFAVPPGSQRERCVPSSTLLDQSSRFKFSCSASNPSFSVHGPAYRLFESNFDRLSQLKSELAGCKKPLIVTGYSLGGSVAALFTLWFLQTTDSLSAPTRPLCITFGSPLIGDTCLQRILENSIWNSCFLHVVAAQDPVPKLLIHPNAASQSVEFKPFGIFLMASESGCACFDDPDMILKLLRRQRSENLRDYSLGNEDYLAHYKEILKKLEWMLLLKGASQVGGSVTDPLQAGLFLQLEAIGVRDIQSNDATALVCEMVERKKKREAEKMKALDTKKKLNKVKINMVYLEWYKKFCSRGQRGYYDCYKGQSSPSDRKVAAIIKELHIYWNQIISDAMKKPQTESEGAALRKGWLYGGTNYRRMVEPLETADHYNEGNLTDFRTSEKAWHFRQLEKLVEEDKKQASRTIEEDNNQQRGTKSKNNLKDLLTMDSCFWDHVEQALIGCRTLREGNISDEKRAETKMNLKEFLPYVMRLIKSHEVSPEIFLPGSSYMQWWLEFKKLNLADYESELVHYMEHGKYIEYGR